METIAISDLRANLPRLINRVSERLERLVITVSGKPKAVVISPEELESLEETAEIMATPGAYKSIKQSLEELELAKKGKLKLIPASKVFKKSRS